MYIDILNIILVIVLVIILVYLGYNLYLESKDVVKYEPPEFEDSNNKEVLESYQEIPVYNSKIYFKSVDNFTGLVSFRVKTNKDFQIDWGNGLNVPYTSSSFVQNLPPMFYNKGKYTITIHCQKDTFEILEYIGSSPDLYDIQFENTEVPSGFKFTGNLTKNV